MSVIEDLSQRTPEEIEARIAHTRKALDRKLDKLGERLDPNVRLAELKEGVAARVEGLKDGVSSRAPQLYAWGAIGAIAAGTMMAVSSWRRLQADGEDLYLCGCVADEMTDRGMDVSFGDTTPGDLGIIGE